MNKQKKTKYIKRKTERKEIHVQWVELCIHKLRAIIQVARRLLKERKRYCERGREFHELVCGWYQPRA